MIRHPTVTRRRRRRLHPVSRRRRRRRRHRRSSPPPGAPPPPPIPVAATTTWRSLRGLTTALTVLLWLAAADAVFGVVAYINRINVLGDIIDGRFDSDIVQRADDSRDLLNAATTIMGLLSLAIFVLIIIWMFRAMKNNETLGRSNARLSPGWESAAGSFPLANFVIPVLILQDLWRGSDPGSPRNDPGWRTTSGSALVAWYWVAHVISSARFLSEGSDKKLRDLSELRDFRTHDSIAVVGVVATIASAVLGIQVIRRIASRQEECLRTQQASWPAPVTPPVQLRRSRCGCGGFALRRTRVVGPLHQCFGIASITGRAPPFTVTAMTWPSRSLNGDDARPSMSIPTRERALRSSLTPRSLPRSARSWLRPAPRRREDSSAAAVFMSTLAAPVSLTSWSKLSTIRLNASPRRRNSIAPPTSDARFQVAVGPFSAAAVTASSGRVARRANNGECDDDQGTEHHDEHGLAFATASTGASAVPRVDTTKAHQSPLTVSKPPTNARRRCRRIQCCRPDRPRPDPRPRSRSWC